MTTDPPKGPTVPRCELCETEDTRLNAIQLSTDLEPCFVCEQCLEKVLPTIAMLGVTMCPWD